MQAEKSSISEVRAEHGPGPNYNYSSSTSTVGSVDQFGRNNTYGESDANQVNIKGKH